MRKVAKLKKYNQYYFKLWYNRYWYLWFGYHKLFFGSLIWQGCKLRAFNMFAEIKFNLKKRLRWDPNSIFLIALMEVTPNVFLRPMRLGASTLGVPMPINEKKQFVFGVKWIIGLLKEKNGVVKVKDLVDLLSLSIQDKGLAIEKKKSYYSISTKNRSHLNFLK